MSLPLEHIVAYQLGMAVLCGSRYVSVDGLLECIFANFAHMIAHGQALPEHRADFVQALMNNGLPQDVLEEMGLVKKVYDPDEDYTQTLYYGDPGFHVYGQKASEEESES